MNKANFYEVLSAYKRNHRQLFIDREVLETHQKRLLHRLLKDTLPHSPFYEKLLGTPMNSWPIMTGQLLVKEFDRINTIGASYSEAFATAVRADISRQYSRIAGYNHYTPVLSSGSKGRRKAFIMNHEEQIDRIGDILAKLFPDGLKRQATIAYFFRNNNALFFTLDCDVLKFRSYDLFESFEHLLYKLEQQQPDIVFAPASVLLHIAKLRNDGCLNTHFQKVYSIGEVLTARDKLILRQAFGNLGEVYFAAEGLLGMSCEYGRLHLNEEKYFIEREWLDNHRFIPVITNLIATSLPLIRYRQDDILYTDDIPCPCGKITQTVRFIEGRLDDVLLLPGKAHKRIVVYPSLCHNIFSKTLPRNSEYRLIQESPAGLFLSAQTDMQTLENCRNHLQTAWEKTGVNTDKLHWHLNVMEREFDWAESKQRRVQRLTFNLSAVAGTTSRRE